MSTDPVSGRSRRSRRSRKPAPTLPADFIDHLCDLEADAWWRHDHRPYPGPNDSDAPRPIKFVWKPLGQPPSWKVDTR